MSTNHSESMRPVEETFIIQERKYILTNLGMERCLVPSESYPEHLVLQDIKKLDLPEDMFYLTVPISKILYPEDS